MTEINQIKIVYFRKYLKDRGFSDNTVRSYSSTASTFLSEYDSINSDNLRSYRERLLIDNKSSTVNQRINAINCFIKYDNSGIPSTSLVKIRKASFLDNVITKDEYESFKTNLIKDGKNRLYFLIRFMASTGMRISEVLNITVEDIRIGHCNIRSKGNKERRVYIPSILSYEAILWMAENDMQTGYFFLNQSKEKLSPSGARYLIKHYGMKYGIPESHLHPHSFRHRFALNFIEVHKDISMLADLLGHESIETTRIYLKKTADEQRDLINLIVNW